MSPEDAESPHTRRAFLGRTAGAAAGVTAATATAAGTPERTVTPTVMTQNAYLGVGLGELNGVDSLSAVEDAVGDIFANVEPAVYEARADGLAAGIERADPAVVALQEIATIREQDPGDFGDIVSVQASDVVVDFLDRLLTALDERDLDYTIAAETVTTDTELPGETGDGTIDVRLTNRNLLLVRDDLDVGEVTTGTYDAAVELSAGDIPLPFDLQRGYCMADLTLDGVEFTAVSTHLEASSASVRRAQADELLGVLPADRPLVVGGDFNSRPGDDAYDLLTASLTDAYSERNPDADGYTCCQADDLRNEASQLNRRIDAILYHGDLNPTAADRVGHRSEDRVEAELGGETVEVWPSDHAGVVATFELTASVATETPTPTETPTATATPTPTATAASGPGLGVVAGVLGLLLGVGSRRWE